jgi:PASTA domain
MPVPRETCVSRRDVAEILRLMAQRARAEDYGWELPASARRVPTAVPRPRPAAPRRLAPAQRRSPRAAVSLWLALLGVAVAAAAGAWYLRLDRSGPALELTVPSVVGAPEGAAVRELTSQVFAVRALEGPSNGGQGTVVRQFPRPRTILARGALVTIRVATG